MDIEILYEHIFVDNKILDTNEIKNRIDILIKSNKLDNTVEGLFNLLLYYIKSKIKERIAQELFNNYNLPIDKIKDIIKQESGKYNITLPDDIIDDLLKDYK